MKISWATITIIILLILLCFPALLSAKYWSSLINESFTNPATPNPNTNKVVTQNALVINTNFYMLVTIIILLLLIFPMLYYIYIKK
jgi:flagellar biosynthesis protein FlhB